MRLIHTRAHKKRDRAEAALLREQARQLAAPRHAAERAPDPDRPLWRQPTVAALLSEARRRRAERDHHE